jgi:hypothetical protein
MMSFSKFVGLGIVAVLVLDATASFGLLEVDSPDRYMEAISAVFYATTGYLAYRHAGLGRAINAALLIATADAILGRIIMMWMTTTLPFKPSLLVGPLFFTIPAVIVSAVFCSCIGAALARILHGRPLDVNQQADYSDPRMDDDVRRSPMRGVGRGLFFVGMSVVGLDLLAQAYAAFAEIVYADSGGLGFAGWWGIAMIVMPCNVIALILTPFTFANRRQTAGSIYLFLCLAVWVGPIIISLRYYY